MNETNSENWLFKLAYDGKDFHGWQIQPGQRTVQGEFQDRLSKLFTMEAKVFGCSRTDTGVHALSQMVTFYPPVWPPISMDNSCRALRNSLPKDIRLVAAMHRPPDFHARFNALGKAYSYLIHTDYLPSPFWYDYCLEFHSKLDLKKMKEAANGLIGRHDFVNFSVKSNEPTELNTIRDVQQIYIHKWGKLIMITILANAFLYRMARRIIGFLIAVGCGRTSPDTIKKLLQYPVVTTAFDTAPSSGLFLVEVFYNETDMQAFRPRQLPLLAMFQPTDLEPVNVL